MCKFKQRLLTLLISVISFNSYSQTDYIKGYFIDDNNEKINCFIKDKDWKNNPTEFEYKLTESSESKLQTITNVQEFVISNNSKFKRFLVKIDKSSENIDNMNSDKNPIFVEELLFLKALVEGKATLYFYEERNLTRFFYTIDNSSIEQLIFKSYKIDKFKIGENQSFKHQLLTNLKCSDMSMQDVGNLGYIKRDLVSYFIKYNECENSEYTHYKKQKRDLFNLSIRPGLNNSSVKVYEAGSGSKDVKFGNKLGLRFGIEAEIVFGFNNNKWSFITEPSFLYFKNGNILYDPMIQNVSIDYKSIELPVGVRHYFFLNDDSKLFINGSLIFNFDLNSNVVYEKSSDFIIHPNINLAFGIGYKYKNKYSIELRQMMTRDLLGLYPLWNADYTNSSLILGYNIF